MVIKLFLQPKPPSRFSHSEKGEHPLSVFNSGAASLRFPYRSTFGSRTLDSPTDPTLARSAWRIPANLSVGRKIHSEFRLKERDTFERVRGFPLLTCHHTNHRGISLYLRGANRLQPTSSQSLPAFIVYHQPSWIFN